MNNNNLTEKEINSNKKLTIFEKEEARLALKKLPKNSLEYKEEKEYLNWLKEWPKRVKEWEEAKLAKKIIKPVIKADIKENNKNDENRKEKTNESIFDPYREEIIKLLKKRFSLLKIWKTINVGSYNGFYHYMKTRKLEDEVEASKIEIILNRKTISSLELT